MIDQPAPPGRRILLGLPAHNEELALPSLLERISAVIQASGVPTGIVLYNDGSKDRTVEIALSWRERLPLQVIGTNDNRGLGAGLLGLVEYALAHASDEDVLVVMDCDDTHHPAQISDMLTIMDARGAEVVIASRFVPGSTVAGVPPLRRVTASGAMILFRLLHPVSGVRDYTCGYRAYRISALRRAQEMFGSGLVSERGFACMVELLLKLAQSKARFAEIPLSLRYDLKQTDSQMDVGSNTRRLLQLLWRWRVKGFDAP